MNCSLSVEQYSQLSNSHPVPCRRLSLEWSPYTGKPDASQDSDVLTGWVPYFPSLWYQLQWDWRSQNLGLCHKVFKGSAHLCVTEQRSLSTNCTNPT